MLTVENLKLFTELYLLHMRTQFGGSAGNEAHFLIFELYNYGGRTYEGVGVWILSCGLLWW